MDPDSMELMLRDLDEDPFPEVDSGTGSQELEQALLAAENATPPSFFDSAKSCPGQMTDHLCPPRWARLVDDPLPAKAAFKNVGLTVDDGAHLAVDLLLQSLVEFEREASKIEPEPLPTNDLVSAIDCLLLLVKKAKTITALSKGVEVMEAIHSIKCHVGTALQVRDFSLSTKNYGSKALNQYFHVVLAAQVSVLLAFHHLEAASSQLLRSATDQDKENHRFPDFSGSAISSEDADSLDLNLDEQINWRKHKELLWLQFLEFLCRISEERSRFTNSFKTTFNCACLSESWYLIFEARSAWAFAQLEVISQRFHIRMIWSILTNLSSLGCCGEPELLTEVLKKVLKRHLQMSPDKSELRGILTSFSQVTSQLSIPINVSFLSDFWDHFSTRLNEMEDSGPGLTGVAWIPLSAEAWLKRLEDQTSTFDVFLQLISGNMKGNDTRMTKTTKQFMGRLRSRLTQLLTNSKEMGIFKLMSLYMTFLKARSADPSAVVEGFVPLIKEEQKRPFTGQKLALFLKGLVAFHSLCPSPEIFYLFSTRMSTAVEEESTEVCQDCVRTYCEMLMTSDLEHPGLIPNGIPRFLKSAGQSLVKTFLLSLTSVLKRFNESAREPTETVKEFKAKVYPEIKQLFIMKSTEEMFSNLSYAITVGPLMSELDELSVITKDDIKVLASSFNVHPEISESVIMAFKSYFTSNLKELIAGWVKFAVSRSSEESDITPIIVQALKIPEPATTVKSILTSISRKVNGHTVGSLREHFSLAFDLFRDVLVKYLPDIVLALPIRQDIYIRIHSVGGFMIEHLSCLMYSPDSNLNKIGRILEILFLSASKKPGLSGIQKVQVKKTLPMAIIGISKLPGFTKDPYLRRLLSEILVLYFNKFPMDEDHPFVRSIAGSPDEPELLSRVIFQSLTFKLVQKSSTTSEEAAFFSSFIWLMVKVCKQELAVIEEVVGVLLDRWASSKQQMPGVTLKIVAVCAKGSHRKTLISILESFIDRNLNFNKDSTFKILTLMAREDRDLVRALMPCLRSNFAIKNQYEKEALSKRLTELDALLE